ncbi:MAG: glycosyltransferase [Bacteroidota bacterium]
MLKPSPSTLSVLVTYHNEGPLLTECLQTLRAGDHQPDELLIYDDASSVPPQPFIPPGFSCIKIIQGEVNRGPGFGRNVLLQNTTCEYVHFHDADDWFHPHWCAAMRQRLAQHPDLVVCGIKKVVGGLAVCEDLMEINTLIERAGDVIKMGLGGSILTSSTVFRRELGLQIGGYLEREKLRQSEDFHFHLLLASRCKSVALIKSPLIIRQERKTSHSTENSGREIWRSALKGLNLLENELLPAYQEPLSEAYARVGTKLFYRHCREEARRAFRRAKELGVREFQGRKECFGKIARVFGQEVAEWMSLGLQTAKKGFS